MKKYRHWQDRVKDEVNHFMQVAAVDTCTKALHTASYMDPNYKKIV